MKNKYISNMKNKNIANMNCNESEKLNNTLTACVDWLAFTSTQISNASQMMNLLGYDESDFRLLPKGALGYRVQHSHTAYPVYILSDGNSDMGINVTIGGSAFHDVLTHFSRSITHVTPFADSVTELSDFNNSILIEFLQQVRNIGHISRLDLAVDDHKPHFSINDILDFIKCKAIISPFHTYKYVYSGDFNGNITGHTIYLGSRKSDVFIRIYDKQLEQKKKAVPAGSASNNHWIRWELELKNDRADKAADFIIQRKQIGAVTMEILNNYVSFVELNNNNRYRCSMHPRWKSFLGTVEKLHLYVPSAPKTLDDKRNWIKYQCLPTIAGIVRADGGSLDVITQNIDDAAERMSKEMRSLVELDRLSRKNDGSDATPDQPA